MSILPKDLSPEMLVSNPTLLLHTKPNLEELTAGDGLVGMIISNGRQIITSPNQKVLYHPPLGGDRVVFMRNDLRFGDDDPLQWPQPYIEEARHLACIPKQPVEENAYSIFWWTPSREDFIPEDHGVIRGIGKLPWRKLESLSTFCDLIITRAKKPQFERLSLALRLTQTLQDILHRLKNISSSFRSMQLGVRALQRVYLELAAALDFHEVFEPLMEGETQTRSLVVKHRMGVFTSDLNVCNKMFRARIPVWFIRPYRALHSIRIISTTNVQSARGLINLDPVSRPNYPPIYSGSPDNPAIYHALVKHISSYLRYPDPFGLVRAETIASAPLPEPGPSKRELRSKRFSPYANRKKNTATGSSGRNKFEDPPSTLLPLAIPSWRQSLESVDITTAQFRYPEVIPSDLGYVFPEPASFVSVQSPERRKGFFQTWLRYRSTLIYRMSSGLSDAQPMPNTVWRTLLSGEFIAKSEKPGTRSQKFKDLAKDFLQCCLDAEGVELSESDHPNTQPMWNGKDFEVLGDDEYEEILWELAELNFRFELMALDQRATTAPSDSRQDLISACFPKSPTGASNLLVVDLSNANQGLASGSWEVRGTYVLALQKVMSSWRGDLSPIFHVKKTIWHPNEAEELETAITQHYCKIFYEYFRRAPIVPRRLSHIVSPYHPPTPTITIQDPRPNILYDVSALDL